MAVLGIIRMGGHLCWGTVLLGGEVVRGVLMAAEGALDLVLLVLDLDSDRALKNRTTKSIVEKLC